MNKYEPKQIEAKWQKVWEEKGVFKADDFSKKPKYYALTEFPYPSGEGLHTGHVFNYTIPDIFARMKRMQGNNVLFPMGWDAFGLPTENYAIKTGIKPQIVTKNNTDRFRAQMKMLGLSFDWSREVNTTDPSYYKWTQYIFQLLFKHGLAYKAATKVGWCPHCKIVLAKEETVNGKCERCGTEATEKVQSQWVLRITKYADRLDFELDGVDYPDYVKTSQRNWIGRKEGANIKFKIHDSGFTIQELEVFTTRPDTIFGVTFIALAVDHSFVVELARKNKELEDYINSHQSETKDHKKEQPKEKTGVDTGIKAVNPINGLEVPIWVSDYVISGTGTGAVMGVPGHDRRDFEFAKKYSLPIVRVVVGKNGDESPIETAEQVIEKGTEGMFVNSDFLNGMSFEAGLQKTMDYFEEKGWGKRVTTYHLRDWIFSRQHYWGDPTPMVFCQKCAQKGITWWDTDDGKNFRPMFDPKAPTGVDANRRPVELAGWMPVPEKDLPVILPEVEKYQPSDNGESPLANITSWVETKCPNCGGPARRETDTMPNWAGSSWYYLRYCDVFSVSSLADPKKLKYWMPVDIYFGGAEHTTLHVLYSRFWHKFLNDLKLAPGKEPYAARRQHGMILAENGSKMSKSKGNVINPDEMVAKYGADALRTYVAFMGPYDQTMPWQTAAVEGVSRFLIRVFKIYFDGEKISSVGNDGILRSKLNRTIQRVAGGVSELRQNVGVAALMEFLNEWEKQGKVLSRDDAGDYLKLISVYAPHLAEELWQKLQGYDGLATKEFASIHLSAWPKISSEEDIEEEIAIAVSINGKTRGILRSSIQDVRVLGEKGIIAKAQTIDSVRSFLTEKTVKNIVYVPGRVVNFVTE